MGIRYQGWFIWALGVQLSHITWALHHWSPVHNFRSHPGNPLWQRKPCEGLHRVSRNILSMTQKALVQRWHSQQHVTHPFTTGMEDRASLPSPVPVNTPDNDAQATGELHACHLDDSFCQKPGGRASAVLPTPQGRRVEDRKPLPGRGSDLTGKLSFACRTIFEAFCSSPLEKRKGLKCCFQHDLFAKVSLTCIHGLGNLYTQNKVGKWNS